MPREWNATALEVLNDLLATLKPYGYGLLVGGEKVSYYPRDPASPTSGGSAVAIVRRTNVAKNTSRHNDALLNSLPSLGWTKVDVGFGLGGRGGRYVHMLGYELSAHPNNYAEYLGVDLTIILNP